MATTPRWGGLRPEPYDPNARDADGDGIVQEGTAFERPVGTQIWDGLNQLTEGLVSPDRDTGWLVYNPEEYSFVEYTPSYGGAFETPKTDSIQKTVGTIGSQTGTVGDRQGIIGDRGTLENIVGTISQPPTPRPIERRDKDKTPEITEAPVAPASAQFAGDSRLPEGFVPGMILPEQEELFKQTVQDARQSITGEYTLGIMIQGRSAELEKALRDFPEVYDRLKERVAYHTLEGLRKEFDDSLDKPITIAMPEGVLSQVLADGRYKTQFESAVSGGLLNPDFRSDYEMAHMGVPKTIDPTLRPVYGFRETGAEDSSVTSMYGNTAIVLKTDVADRTTITVGDSLNGLFPVPHGQSASDDRLLAAANQQQLLGHSGNGLLAALQELRDDETLDDGWKPLIDKALTGLEPDLYIKPHYVESQIFGGVRAEDIDHVRLPWDVKPELVEDLRVRGISFYVQKRDESDITFEERFDDDVRTSQFDTPEITPTPVPRQRAQQVPEFASSAGDLVGQDKPSDIPGATPSSQAEAPAAPNDGVPEWLTPEELTRLEPDFIPGKPTWKVKQTIDIRAASGKKDIARSGYAEIAHILGPDWKFQKVQDDPVFQELVTRHEKLVIEELRSELEAAKEFEIVIAVPETLIRQIITDGRYKSQFETNRSGGMLNAGMRRSFEEAALGVSPSVDPTARPLYAFVDTLEGFENDRLNVQYGDGRIHLKESSKQRSTLTLGDSLDESAVPVSFFGDIDDDRVLAASGNVSSSQKTPSALYEAATSMLEDGSLGDDADIYGPLLQKIAENLDPDFNDTMVDQTAYYTEAQIHGQVRVEDIELVTLPAFYETMLEDEDEEWLRETVEVFERNGIPYRFGYDGDIVTPERPAAAAAQEPVPVSSERTYDPFDTSAPDYDPTRDPFSDSFIGFQDETPTMDVAGEGIPEVSASPSPRLAEFSQVTDYESFGDSGRELEAIRGRSALEEARRKLQAEKDALEKTINEWRQTGVWNGETNGVALPRVKNPRSGITQNISKEDMIAYGDDEELANTFGQYVSQIDRQLQHVDGRLADLDEIESGKVVSSINEMTIRDMPNYEELVERGKEIRRVHSTEMTDALQEADPDHVWLLHTGSSTLDGGVLDPNFTLGAGGDGTGLRRTMDTRRANQSNMDRMARTYESAQKQKEAWAEALLELEETGNWNGTALDERLGGGAMELDKFVPASSLTQQQRDDLKQRVTKIVDSLNETMDTFEYAYNEITAGNTYLSYYGIRSPGTGYVRMDSPTSTMYLVRVPKDEAYSGFPTAEYQIFGARKPVVSYEFRSQTDGGGGDSLYAALALMEQSALRSVSAERPS